MRRFRGGQFGLAARLLLVLGVVGVVGCAQTRMIEIKTDPPDATIKLDGIERGRGQVVVPLAFKNSGDVHTVSVSRTGFKEVARQIRRDQTERTIQIALRPLTRKITINVEPAPALLRIDGALVDERPISSITRELEFTVNPRTNAWTTHHVTAERQGFEPGELTVSWLDDPQYILTLQPMRKDLTITSTPIGATVFIDGEHFGPTPLTIPDRPFPSDVETGEWIAQSLRLEKPGYDPVETKLSWDDGRTDYAFELPPKAKTVRIVTDPPAAMVTLEGKPLDRDAEGAAVARLTFTPVNEQGDLRTYTFDVTHKTEASEWHPGKLSVGWDDGRRDYTIALKEILTTPAPILSAEFERTDDGWQITPKWGETLAMKSPRERGGDRVAIKPITSLPAGSMLDTLAISPDGSQIIFTVLSGRTINDFRSQMLVTRTEGGGAAEMYNDGQTLDLTPSFTASGDQIVFASNRAGRRLSIWQMSAEGDPGVTQLTSGETTNDLWPTIDSDPKPRLYYQAMVDTRPDPRLYMTQLGTTIRTDLTHVSGTQPRVSPKADIVVFTVRNEKTGKRDIYRMSDRGGNPQNLTNTPDIDEHDPTWSRDGSKIAFSADRGTDEEKRRNYDIWVMDALRPGAATQVTTNGSWDDRPAWDPVGNRIYFRSNRGGQWGIWRIDF